MRLHYFSTKEFRGQKRLISPRLLVNIDTFRHMWGRPVIVSPHPAAIGRDSGNSQHNYLIHGETRAIDLMPQGMDSYEEAQRAIGIARMIGFTGIGIYPHWKPSPGIHLDVREDRAPSHPAVWGGIQVDGKQVYVSLEEALSEMKTEMRDRLGT